MELKDYQENVKRTNTDLGSKALNIAHMIYGMTSEFVELYEAIDDVNRGEELTDINWYLNNYCNITGVDLWRIAEFIPFQYYRILEDDNYIETLFCKVSELIDLEKKELAYGKILEMEKRIEKVISIFEALNDAYAYYNLDPFVSMQKNIDKLRVRYPLKFDNENALNRDLAAERKVLEA